MKSLLHRFLGEGEEGVGREENGVLVLHKFTCLWFTAWL